MIDHKCHKKKISPPGPKFGKNPVDLGGPKDFRTQSQTCCGKHLPPRSVSSHFVSLKHSSSVPKAQERPVTRVEVKARTTEMNIREKFMVEFELHRPHTCVICNLYYTGFRMEMLKQWRTSRQDGKLSTFIQKLLCVGKYF